MPRDAPTIVERLADFVCGLRYEDIPERVLRRARYQTLGVFASMHAGVDAEPVRAVRRAVARWDKPGRCTLIPSGEKTALHEAVLVNTAASMALDYDDYLYMGHTGHSAVLASLAIAEDEGLGARELVTAQVIANEVGGRIGASAVLGPQNGQAWSFIHAVEGAVVASRLYGLSRTETAHALAIALYQPTFTLWPGFMGPGSKVLTAAGPTVTGMQSAQFAREGLTGALEIVEHPRKGFFRFFTFTPLPHVLSGFGDAWVSDTLAYKRYPGCAYIDTTMDALFEVLDAHARETGRALRPDDVRRIDVRANLLTVEMDNLSAEHVDDTAPLSPININFSIPFNVAIGIVAGRHTGAELTQAFLDAHDAEIRALAARVELEHDWEMTARVADAFDRVLGEASVLARLSPRELVSVVLGYQRELGGKKRHSLGLGALVGRHGADVLRLAAAKTRARRGSAHDRDRSSDLSGVDFTRFEMAFPAEVTIETTDGRRRSARVDIPLGAPGRGDYAEIVEQKYRIEAGMRQDAERVDRTIAAVRTFERAELGALTGLVCGR
jgi:2-methylcitrate dehydratase PrpD